MDDEWTDDEPDDELDIVVKSDSEDEGGIEATPEPEPKPKPVKPKKKMSEKQLAALAAGRAKRDVGRNAKKGTKN